MIAAAFVLALLVAIHVSPWLSDSTGRRTWDLLGLFASVAAMAFGVVVVRYSVRNRRELEMSERRWRLLADGTPDCGIFMLDRDGVITTWNLGAERIKGYTEAEAVGHHFSMFYTAEARASGDPEAALDHACKTGRHEEQGWRVRKDGSIFLAGVVITALTDSAGVPQGFSKMTRDLTAFEMLDRRRRASEERFRRAFDDAPTAAALTGRDGRFVQVNAAMSQLLGYPPEVLLSTGGLELTHPDDRAADGDAFAELVSGDLESYSRDKRYLSSDGQVVWARVHAVPVLDHDGSVSAVLVHALDITQRRHYEQQLVELATHDPLTGLANRTRFQQELAGHLDRCRRYGATGAVLMLDLDNFKRVNDTFGHNAGDELIISTAALLRSRMRAADVVARLGGDEFAILLPEGGREAAEHVAEAIGAGVRQDVTALNGGRPRTVTVSIGIAVITDPDVSAHEALAAADLAMYDAKDAGRDRWACYADELHPVSRTKAQFTWAERMEFALETDSFELWAQPILNLRSNEIESHELLLRMRTPEGELLLPGRFLYIAERTGLIREIDRWVAGQAVDLLARIQTVRPGHRLEVNLSGLSVGDDELRSYIAQEISRSQVDPTGLVFEITETAAVQHIVDARDFARALEEIGCKFALDDFGAGFGSFYYLKHLPCDYVKIDGEFIGGCTTNLADRLVIDSVVSIARGLGKQTVAEFVGDQATLDLVRSKDVDYAQGFYIGRPVPLAEGFPDLVMPAIPRQPQNRPPILV